MRLNPEIPQEARIALDNIESPVFLIHFLSSNINVEVADKQRLLEERNGHKQATLLLQYMMREIEMLELKREIQSKASSDIDQQQRDYYLRQQIKVLHDELGMDSPERDHGRYPCRKQARKNGRTLFVRILIKNWPNCNASIQWHLNIR